MTCKLRGRLRPPENLKGKITGTRVVGPDGVYIDGAFQGVADGWYDENQPGLVPDGLWEGGVNTGPLSDGLYLGGAFEGVVDGYYEQNQRVTMADGIWIGEVYQGTATGYYVDNSPAPVPDGYWSGGVLGPVPDGVWSGGNNAGLAQGYYVNNEPAPIPDGCYRNGGLVDPYYEAIIKAAQAEGGGLYLFQLEHGMYAGQRVAWQDAAGTIPWEPGQGAPQGKVLDLCGSGEYLSQSVSMRRPVDGVWDGVGTWLDASSMAVGEHLHQSKPSSWFIGTEPITVPINANLLSTGTAAATAGVEVRNVNNGIINHRRSGGVAVGSQTAYEIGLEPGTGLHVVGASYGTRRRIYFDGQIVADDDPVAPYPDVPPIGILRLGARTIDGLYSHAHYTYLAIYTREPTPYEISLHKRTP